ncbi:flagellar basal-body rod protein FlgB [Desulfonatronospira thiodismutans ASO3-1]|uniref:Flagellar basal body rod protein FlgB n=1 Tax=Desulfonatronospira thiodismutans ASO3-1 TaxID=555779 RepID=D6STA8_9BACT|nr:MULTISPECIES: flagellar basal body rod protein FlgB [Desulfonatronospira]EFI33924.1 flagellar basal-body rod protein FlgB [Desulfonatronospira thiodismutans ASO3-1]RQD72980.1 MAG: flagellar basal body rod protein FlgB [Desulfonatronospira sp. MSAO_Bac3]
MKALFGDHIQLTSRVLDMRLERQNVVSSNLANVKTPGYQARRVEFEEQLQSALNLDARGKMARTDPGHVSGAFDPQGFNAQFIKSMEPRVYQGEDAVDLDKEMSIMSQNTLMYNALSMVQQKNFQGLKTVIREGGQ